MGRNSSLLGADEAPLEADGRDVEALGPSESSDSGSDCIGADDLPAADPNEPVDVTLGRDVARRSIEGSEGSDEAQPGADISVDRVFTPDEEERAGAEDEAEVAR